MILYLLLFVIQMIWLVVSFYVTYWTYKDAKRRGMDSPYPWALVVLFGSIPGFIAYLLVRE